MLIVMMMLAMMAMVMVLHESDGDGGDGDGACVITMGTVVAIPARITATTIIIKIS